MQVYQIPKLHALATPWVSEINKKGTGKIMKLGSRALKRNGPFEPWSPDVK